MRGRARLPKWPWAITQNFDHPPHFGLQSGDLCLEGFKGLGRGDMP